MLYHLSVKPIKRSDGRSIVNAAAYRAAERLNDYKYGKVRDYTRKGGVVFSEILLPVNAPSKFYNREILWNEVEKIEKSSVARLGREIEISFPYEFTSEERRKVIREYIQANFVDQGMCADYSIHEPDKKRENPHVHVLLTTRAFNENGEWLPKKRKDYLLDDNGKKQYDRLKKTYKFTTVSTTDWDNREKVEMWRQNWYKVCLREFNRKGIDASEFDHRSYARRGLLVTPNHLSMAVSQMEDKGIRTMLGDKKRENIIKDQLTIQEMKNRADTLAYTEKTVGQTMFEEAVSGENQKSVLLYDVNSKSDQKLSSHDQSVREPMTNESILESLKKEYFDLAVEEDLAKKRLEALRVDRNKVRASIALLKKRRENLTFFEKEVERISGAGEDVSLTREKLARVRRNLNRDFKISPDQIDEMMESLHEELSGIDERENGITSIPELEERRAALLQSIQENVDREPASMDTFRRPEKGQGGFDLTMAEKREQVVLKQAEEQLRRYLSADDQKDRERSRGRVRGR